MVDKPNDKRRAVHDAAQIVAEYMLEHVKPQDFNDQVEDLLDEIWMESNDLAVEMRQKVDKP